MNYLMEDTTFAFIGAGAMAEALIGGLIESGTTRPEQIRVTNRNNQVKLQQLSERWSVLSGPDKTEAMTGADIIILAVKPQDIGPAVEEIAARLKPDQAVVSTVAGVPLEWLEAQLPFQIPMVRTMPNTSCQVRAAATALACNSRVETDLKEMVAQLFESVGEVVFVQEDDLDAVTGLSGSGPAYVYFMLEALIEAGSEAGLERSVAEQLAVQTVYGAAKTVKETGADPAKLRHAVMSPGGTTVEAIRTLEAGHFTSLMIDAVEKATKRSRELGQETIDSAAATT